MLRLYKPIKHDIFKLQDMLEHLVCSVWCEADENSCRDKLTKEFRDLYDSYEWLKNQVDEIYQLFEGLTPFEKINIKHAFVTNNSIEELCNGSLKPIHLKDLPNIIESKVKPLLVDFYETLLERAKVPGTKKEYYEKLIKYNDYKYCPCCGLIDFEYVDSSYREAFDHYLPKSEYPFASVNFKNLVPLCHKCNSDRKGHKDPLKVGKVAFYPFCMNPHNITISLKIDETKPLDKLNRKDLILKLDGENDKISTWNKLFDIEERYNDITRREIKSHLRKVKRRHADYAEGRAKWSYVDTLNKLILDYEYDKYEDKKFLKIPLMEALKSCSYLIDVYG